ncbi:FUSC family protein [Halomonas sp. XH26]|uniref:FUSC family protein n=1 Tax=Halomonadaceae TaxID=28256 RepID=UPI000EA31B19|nr:MULTISPECIES: FUSC family protein [Halomonas]AYF34039.1 transporter [Halomonas alkaliphila]UTA79232.1 FUSC family protein [Halomonas sp. XH26]
MSSHASMLRAVINDLRPYDGRLEMTLHIALLCGLTAVVAMTLQVPLALLSCYLIFLMYRDNAGENIGIGVGLILAATVIIALSILLMMFVADAPALRLAMMGAVTFGFMWLARASKLGEPAGLLGFIIVFILTFYDYISMPELVLRGLAWVWMVVFVPMVLLVALNVFVGRSPLRLVRERVRERLHETARLSEGGDPTPTDRLLREGNEVAEKHAGMARLLALVSKEEHDRLVAELAASFNLLATAQAATAAGRPEPELAPLLRRLAEEGSSPPLPEGGGLVADAVRTFVAARNVATVTVPTSSEAKSGFLKPDAFENPIYIQFALKVLLAVFLTYALYTSIGLFEIHTAMVTCFVVALGTSGETFHKSILRIIGCLIGAAMGAFAVVFVMPHLDDPGHLFLLIAAGSLIAGWVATGSYRVQYAGFQMALAFFICVLPGSPLDFGPNYNLSDAGYRVLGILVGIGIMGLVFSLVWPESAKDTRDSEVDAALVVMAEVLRGEDRLDDMYRHIGAAHHAQEVMRFEWAGPIAREQGEGVRRLAAIDELARLLPLISVKNAAPLAAALEATTEHTSAVLDLNDAGDNVYKRARVLVGILTGESE